MLRILIYNNINIIFPIVRNVVQYDISYFRYLNFVTVKYHLRTIKNNGECLAIHGGLSITPLNTSEVCQWGVSLPPTSSGNLLTNQCFRGQMLQAPLTL